MKCRLVWEVDGRREGGQKITWEKGREGLGENVKNQGIWRDLGPQWTGKVARKTGTQNVGFLGEIREGGFM